MGLRTALLHINSVRSNERMSLCVWHCPCKDAFRWTKGHFWTCVGQRVAGTSPGRVVFVLCLSRVSVPVTVLREQRIRLNVECVQRPLAVVVVLWKMCLAVEASRCLCVLVVHRIQLVPPPSAAVLSVVGLCPFAVSSATSSPAKKEKWSLAPKPWSSPMSTSRTLAKTTLMTNSRKSSLHLVRKKKCHLYIKPPGLSGQAKFSWFVDFLLSMGLF